MKKYLSAASMTNEAEVLFDKKNLRRSSPVICTGLIGEDFWLGLNPADRGFLGEILIHFSEGENSEIIVIKEHS